MEVDGYGRRLLLVRSPLVRPALEKIGDSGDPGLDGSFGEVAEAEDELGRLGCVCGAVVAHPVEPHRAFAGGGDYPGFVDRLRQMRYGMKSRGQAGEPYLRSKMLERF